MPDRSMRILAFAREAGGAAAIAPVILALRSDSSVICLAKDFAKSVFERAGVEISPVDHFSEEILLGAVRKVGVDFSPDAVLTSAASLPGVDETERQLWIWASRRGIPSVAVVDQWQNLALRFSGSGPSEHLAYLPSKIAVMDAGAKRSLVRSGVPAGRIAITGQPALEGLRKGEGRPDPEARATIRSRLGLGPRTRLLTFVSESFARDFGETLGYTEQTALASLIDILERFAGRARADLALVVRLHPQNRRDDFQWLKEVDSRGVLEVRVEEADRSPHPLIAASDVVVGMTSVLLLESILLGRPTVSYQPGARRIDGLVATVIGAIPLLDREEDGLFTLERLLCNSPFRARYLQRQRRFHVRGGAARRVAQLVRSCASSRWMTRSKTATSVRHPMAPTLIREASA